MLRVVSLSFRSTSRSRSSTSAVAAEIGLGHACWLRGAVAVPELRLLSTGAPLEPAAADTRGHRIIRLLAVATIAVVGVGVLPTMATHSVAHGVALLDAQEPFLQKSGCERVRLMASASDANVGKLVSAGAPVKLVAMLRQTSDDGVRIAALQCLSVLARMETGRRGVTEAGALKLLSDMSVPTAGSCDVTREADGLLHMLREANGVEAAR